MNPLSPLPIPRKADITLVKPSAAIIAAAPVATKTYYIIMNLYFKIMS
jgi:hypothetical protein